MSNGRTCGECGAYGDPPPCKDWRECRRKETESDEQTTSIAELKDRIDALERRCDALEEPTINQRLHALPLGPNAAVSVPAGYFGPDDPPVAMTYPADGAPFPVVVPDDEADS